MKFMKYFTNYMEAQKFATIKRGRITISYDWDSNTNSLVRFYIVKF